MSELIKCAIILAAKDENYQPLPKRHVFFGILWLIILLEQMSGISKSECQILEPNSDLTFSSFFLSEAISLYFDHQDFGFSRRLSAARFYRLPEFLSED